MKQINEKFKEERTYKAIRGITFHLWEKYGKRRVYLNRENGRGDGWLDLDTMEWHGTPEKCECYAEEIADFEANCLE